MICQKKLREIGGRRLVAQQQRGVSVVPSEEAGPDTESVPEQPGLALRLWGGGDFDTAEVRERARQTLAEGRRPWFCQACGGRACGQCGAPLNMPMGSDCLDDEGQVTHFGNFPVRPACTNPQCNRFKEG